MVSKHREGMMWSVNEHGCLVCNRPFSWTMPHENGHDLKLEEKLKVNLIC